MDYQKIIDTANACLQKQYKISDYMRMLGKHNKALSEDSQAIIHQRISELQNEIENEERKLKKLTA